MRIFLIGFMGSGKSHTGKRLAKLLNASFTDLDEWIEHREQASVREIFANKGEHYFRQAEQLALHDMARFDEAVIACGGGTPCFFDNMQWMNEHGLTIYLKAPVKVLASRLRAQQEQRPLLKGLDAPGLRQFIGPILLEREAYYQQASIVYEQKAEGEDIAGALARHFKDIIGH